MELSRASIVNCAVEILQEYGLADMTMRRIARTLQVAPSALYWHIANKQELVQAVALSMLSPFIKQAVRGDARASISMLRNLLDSYRDGGELMGAAMALPDMHDVVVERIAQELIHDPSYTGNQPRLVAEAVVHMTIGATYIHQLRASMTEASSHGAVGADSEAQQQDNFDDSIALIIANSNLGQFGGSG